MPGACRRQERVRATNTMVTCFVASASISRDPELIWRADQRADLRTS
jgi:hypothetical protein